MFWRFWKRGHLRYQALLSEYMDNRLSAADQEQLEEHLGSCTKCSEDMESLRATVGLLREVPVVEPARSFRLQAAPAQEPGKPFLLWSVQASTVAAAMLLVALVAGDLTGAFDGNGARFESEMSDEQQSYEIMASDYQLEEAAAAPEPAPSQASPGVEDSAEPMQAQEFSLPEAQETEMILQKDDAALEDTESREAAAVPVEVEDLGPEAAAAPVGVEDLGPEAAAPPVEVEDLGEAAPTDTDGGDSVLRKIEIAVGSTLAVLVVATGYLIYRRRRMA